MRNAADRKGLWRAVARGDVDIVASDHSPAPPEMKQDANFFRVWGGVAGVQSTLAVLMEFAQLPRIAELMGTSPAARFGLARKGRIAIGCDADFALVDLRAGYTVTRESLFQRHGLSPYLGAGFRGVVRRTVLRGETVFADGKMTEQAQGRMIAHAQPRIHT